MSASWWKNWECIWLALVHRLGFDQPIPHHSTFSKNRHGRFAESNLFQLSQETVAAQQMITRFSQRRACSPVSIAADATYGNGEFLQWRLDLGIPYMPARIAFTRRTAVSTATSDSPYQPTSDTYLCPEGKQLKYVGVSTSNRTHLYASTAKRCRECSQKIQCTRGKYKMLAIHIHKPARQ